MDIPAEAAERSRAAVAPGPHGSVGRAVSGSGVEGVRQRCEETTPIPRRDLEGSRGARSLRDHGNQSLPQTNHRDPHPDTRSTHTPTSPQLTTQAIDASLIASIKKVDNLSKYLKASWGLSRGDRFHELKF